MRRHRKVLMAFVLMLVVCATGGWNQLIRDRIRERRASRRGEVTRTPGHASGNDAVTCEGKPNAGFRIVQFSSGLRAAAWYPALVAEKQFAYANGLGSAVAENAPLAPCAQYPLVVFSHGFGGCSTQSLFFTEELARHGYVVIAPDHKDAGCKVDEPREGRLFHRAEEPFLRPEEWTDQTYIDRRDDIRVVLDQLPANPDFGAHVDMERVAGVGHSLGGYTMLAMAGGWRNWTEPRIKALLLFSPYARPFLTRGSLKAVHIPVMYQGGEKDRGITPYLKKSGGVYDQSNRPKYLVEFRNQGHLDWTVRACGSARTVETCIASSPNVKAVNSYGFQFLEEYVAAAGLSQGRPLPATLNAAGGDQGTVATYRAQQ